MSNKIKKEITAIIQKFVGKEIEVVLTEPPNVEMGDFSWAVFEWAKKKKKNPPQLAQEISTEINKNLGKYKILRGVQAVGPYLNIFVDQEKLTKETLGAKLRAKKNQGKVALDVFQANPLKIFHIGHLRNAVLGESIRRLLKFSGYQTVTYSYSGDVGIHVARWLWYFKNFYQGKIPQEDFTKWAGEIYTKACVKMTEKEEYQQAVAEINRLLDKRDRKIIKLWRDLTKKSYQASWQIAKELACRVDHSFPESVCEKPGKKYIEQKIKQGKIKQDQGAWVVDLKKYKLGVFILLKSDGTALYQTKDYGLAELRRKKIKNFDKCLFVVGEEQNFYFQQLFKSMEVLKYPGWQKNEHLAHGLVSLKEGKMASRLGNVIAYDDLRDQTIKKVLAEMAKRNPRLKNKEEVAKKVALGALKFSLLQVDRLKSIKFDWQQALSFEGNSGPYLQYTYARIKSIERKAKKNRNTKTQKHKIDYGLLSNVAEVRLIKTLGKFEEAISNAGESYQPAVIANYLLDLAAEFNHFYHQCQVLDPEHLEISRARLVLITKVAEVLEQGLDLLGIEVVEEM